MACAENIEKISRIQQNNPNNNTNIEMNLILRPMWTQFHWVYFVLTGSVKSKVLLQKNEVKFLQNSNDMGFSCRIYQKIKLQKDAVPFRRTYGSMSFKKNQAMEKLFKT